MQHTPFDIPEQMREAADKSVDQAKRAFGDFIEATHEAVAKAEGSAKTLQEGAADVNRQALAFVEENVAASLDLARRLLRARSLEEVVAIQKQYVEHQVRGLAEQGKNLGEIMGRAAMAASRVDKKDEPLRRR